jgi:hypothetical protein
MSLDPHLASSNVPEPEQEVLCGCHLPTNHSILDKPAYPTDLSEQP